MGADAAWRWRQMRGAQEAAAASQLYVDEHGVRFIVSDGEVEFDTSQESALGQADPECTQACRVDDSDESSVGSDAAANGAPGLRLRAQRRSGALRRQHKKRRLKARSSRDAMTRSGGVGGGRRPQGTPAAAPAGEGATRVLSGSRHRFGLAATANVIGTTPMLGGDSLLPQVGAVCGSGAEEVVCFVGGPPGSSASSAQTAHKRRRRGQGGVPSSMWAPHAPSTSRFFGHK